MRLEWIKAINQAQPKKAFRAKGIVWPKIITKFQQKNTPFCLRPMDVRDINPVVDLYRKYCPYFYKSSRHSLLEKNFYQTEVCHRSQWQKHSKSRPYFFGIMEDLKLNKIIMAFGCRRDLYDKIIQNLAVILDPAYRGNQIADHYVSYLDNLWRKSGTDYVYGYMSMQHVASQKAFLKVGGHFGGILPGITRRTYDGKTYFRDSQIFMYKFYNNSEKYCTPLENCQLVPQAIDDMKKIINQFLPLL